MRISTKTLSLLAGSLFVVGLMAGTNVGCGSSSSAPSFSQLCMQGCQKCGADAGATYLQLCNSSCTSMAASMAHCTNESAIANAAKTCLDTSTCDALPGCIQSQVPACEGGGGSSGTATGGHTGATGGAGGHATGATGGTTGAAGSGVTADCSVCDKANTCCMFFATASGKPTSTCTLSTTACNASGAAASTYAMGCQEVLTAAGTGVAACQ